MTRYRVHLYVEVTDTDTDDSYDWDSVANRVANRLRRSARKPLDKDARLRIQHVSVDTASDLED